MAHMPSDKNPDRGDRPIRNNFNKIIMTILLLVALAIAFAITFVGFKGKKINQIHKSEVPQLSPSIQA
ncbi:MAG: hypothetical protein ABI380_09960 [Edaphobacter sp.]